MGEVFLDHVGWFVSDMDAASGAFGRLGFPLTPFTIHRNEDAAGNRIPTGTANRCAMLGRGYLEILTDVAGLDTPFARAHREAVARHQGLHLIAFAVDDAQAEARRLDEAGFRPLPVARLRRPMPTDQGGEEEAAFSVLRVPPGTMAEGRMQILRHETPDLVWQDSTIARDNAIAGLAGVLICTDDPAEAAARHARFTGREAAGATVALDRGRLDFVDPGGLARILPGARPPSLPFIAAAVLESADIAATRRFVESAGVPVAELAGGAIAIPPESAMGAWLVARAAGAAWPGVPDNA
ncbi:MAG: VOC family protein [Defluviicoccus sp.]|nr:VOC family protein [Defluviicoccus sp.]